MELLRRDNGEDHNFEGSGITGLAMAGEGQDESSHWRSKLIPEGSKS